MSVEIADAYCGIGSCGTCRSFLVTPNEAVCRRYPPTVFPTFGVMTDKDGEQQTLLTSKWTMYPVVKSDWRCDEYKRGMSSAREPVFTSGPLPRSIMAALAPLEEAA